MVQFHTGLELRPGLGLGLVLGIVLGIGLGSGGGGGGGVTESSDISSEVWGVKGKELTILPEAIQELLRFYIVVSIGLLLIEHLLPSHACIVGGIPFMCSPHKQGNSPSLQGQHKYSTSTRWTKKHSFSGGFSTKSPTVCLNPKSAASSLC